MSDHPELGKDEPGGLYEEGMHDGARFERGDIIQWLKESMDRSNPIVRNVLATVVAGLELEQHRK